jgi:hypothetical protein
VNDLNINQKNELRRKAREELLNYLYVGINKHGSWELKRKEKLNKNKQCFISMNKEKN